MNDDIYLMITDLIDYIERDVMAIKSIEDCMKITHLSKFHLIRIFKAKTDLTIMEYIQGRRMAKTIERLLNSDLKIINIANEFGFNHEQSYIRAFKKAFSITPAKYRKSPFELKITHPLSTKSFMRMRDGILFDEKIVSLPSFYLLGVKNRINGNESFTEDTAKNMGMDFFLNRRNEIKNVEEVDVYYGHTWHEGTKDYSYYLSSLRVNDIKPLPEGMTYKLMTSSDYAVYTYIGSHSVYELSLQHLMDMHRHIDKLNETTHDFMDNPFFFERVDFNLSKTDYCEVKIYFKTT